MKNLLLMITLALFSNSTFASSALEGNYLCKMGFLGFSVVDSLSIHTAKSGNLYIYMNEANFKISQDCQDLNGQNLKVECGNNKDKMTVTKQEKEYKGIVTTTLSFEKIRGMVIVKEEVHSRHGNDLTVLICRAVKN